MAVGEKSKNLIPAEDVEANVRAWDMPSWGEDENKADLSTESEEIDEEPIVLPTAEELENIRQEAQTEGYQQGLLEGKQEGHEQGHQEGYQQGFQEGKTKGLEEGKTQGQKLGFEQGLADAKAEIANEVAALRAIAKQLLAPVNDQQDALEVAFSGLIEQAVRAVVRTQPALSQQDIVHLVHEAVEALPVGAKNIRVYLNARDIDVLGQHWNSPLPVEFINDPELEPGDCRVEATDSLINYRVEDRIEQVLDELRLEHFPEHSPLTTDVEEDLEADDVETEQSELEANVGVVENNEEEHQPDPTIKSDSSIQKEPSQDAPTQANEEDEEPPHDG